LVFQKPIRLKRISPIACNTTNFLTGFFFFLLFSSHYFIPPTQTSTAHTATHEPRHKRCDDSRRSLRSII
ncbi:hypothetical protein, partial [Lactococcus cremoris]